MWLGLFDVTAAPVIGWRLDVAPAEPPALRRLSSVRPEHMLPPGVPLANVPGASAGVYEFTGLRPNTLYEVSAESDQKRVVLEVQTLPAAVPAGLENTFNVMPASCFHQAEDRGGSRAGSSPA